MVLKETPRPAIKKKSPSSAFLKRNPLVSQDDCGSLYLVLRRRSSLGSSVGLVNQMLDNSCRKRCIENKKSEYFFSGGIPAKKLLIR